MYLLAAFFYVILTFSHGKADNEVNLQDKIVVVTGAAKGIGYAIAEHCLINGAKVIIVDKNLPRGLQTEKEFQCRYGANNVWFIHGDITKDLDAVFKLIYIKFKYVDILVNNAGILNEYNPDLMIRTNALATAMWSRKFYGVMRKDRGGKGGTIMNIASISGYMSDPFMTYYKMSKFAVIGLSIGLGHEWNFMTSGIRVFPLCPGFTYTDMTKQQMVVDEQVEIFSKVKKVLPWQTADAVGKGAVTLLKTATTGISYTFEGGVLSVSPDRVNITAEFLLSL